MSWGRPELLYLLWGAPLLLLGVAFALRARRRALASLGALVAGLAGPSAERLHRRRLLGWVVVATLTVLALGQPRWGYRWQELKREGVALVVVLDVSASMNAADVSPSRMERASRKVLDLLDLLAGDRVGLVLFAAGAYPRVPLTLDYDAVRQIVRDSDTQSLGAQGSDLGAAIDEAGKLLASAEGADKAILVISDGEDHVGEGLNAAKRASEAGVHIYTLGVGTPDGAPIPVEGGGFKNDPSGQVVLSRLDEDGLKAIAAAGAGAYARAGAGAADLRALYEDEIRGKLATAEQGSRRDRVWDERYQWPLGVALVLGVLLSGMRARPAAAALLLAAALVAGAPARAGDAEVERLTALQLQNPGDLHVSEQLGEALFKAGDYARAEEVLRGVAERSDDAAQRARARYNEGLAAYRGGRLHRAVEDWQQVLKDQPDHKPAAQNISSVQKELQMRMQQQQQNQQNQQNQQDPTSQDPQAQNQQNSQQDGQPQDPQQAQGEQQNQQNQQNPSDPQQQAQDGSQDRQAPPSDGTREERQPATAAADDTGAADAGEQAQAEQGQADSGQPQDGQAEPKPGKLSAEAAERLVDGLEEGEPRVVVDPKRRGGKDW